MRAKLNLSIEKKTPYRVLFIRAAESMIAVVFRQAIDMTAREGDQDWSWIPFSHASDSPPHQSRLP